MTHKLVTPIDARLEDMRLAIWKRTDALKLTPEVQKVVDELIQYASLYVYSVLITEQLNETLEGLEGMENA
ncbi:hypothetical protein LCGC14_2843470 [marine sediment metagenome]|uniref:Uncharacterized protein n=1 Tax=marine sediment metagenome TaxID=412755 RepID=A0A0F8YAL5_9ZZZZ